MTSPEKQQNQAFQPIWEEEIYGKGQHLARYPYDMVVSFVYRNYPRSKERKDIRILEIGCGAGNNLWFAAREGFSVCGIDGSAAAIEYARKRFKEEGLQGEFHVGDFTKLDFAQDNSFDLAIDRGALVCVGLSAGQQAIREVHRVLAPDGMFLLNPYSDRHTSHSAGTRIADGMTRDITAGTLVGVGDLCFYARKDVETALEQGWKIHSLEHSEIMKMTTPDITIHAEWRVVAQKIA